MQNKNREKKTETIKIRITPTVKKWLEDNGGYSVVIDKLIKSEMNK